MRRMVLSCLLLLALLAGCGGETPPETPEAPPPAEEETEQVPEREEAAEEPPTQPEEPAPPEESEPEAPKEPEEPAPPESPEPESPEPESGGDLTASAMEAYAKITETLTFTLYVEEGDGMGWNLSITPENAWNVEGRENLFPVSYQWSDASAADWAAQAAAMGAEDLLLEMASPDGAAGFRSCTAGDVIAWTAAGETRYARAAALADGEAMSGLLRGIAEDALWDAAFYASTAAGSETDYETAARQLSEAMAENVRAVPDWVSWKPLDFRTDGASVFDAFYGQPENFCAGLSFRLRLDSPDSAMAGRWQAGSGLGEPEADGSYGWGGEAAIRKNADGGWYCDGLATGGSAVSLPLSAPGEEAPLSELVDAFFLTEGLSHDWLVPNYILYHTADEMEALPGLLDRRTGAEARALCAALGECLRTADGWDWTPETLAEAMGPYGRYMDA